MKSQLICTWLTFYFVKQLLPVKAKNLLDKEAIDIRKVSDLSNKNISKGSLIEIDSGKEKIIISVDE